MILAIGSSNKTKAFTLVELVIVLTVLAILGAAAIPSVDSVMKERQAREPVQFLVQMAREVRNKALSEQRPYQIVFDSNGFRAARYFNPYGGQEEFDALQDQLKLQRDRMEIIEASQRRGIQMDDQATIDPRITTAMQGMLFSAQYQLPENLDYRIRFWNDTDWLEMEFGAFRRWVFQPSGMCEPMRIQFQYDYAFFEVEFHPMTADVKDETSWVE